MAESSSTDESSDDTAEVFDYQVEACKTFFTDEAPSGEFKLIADKDRPDNMKHFKGPIYDITGFDAQQVVAVLSDIVNDKDQFKMNKTFYLWINSPESTPQANVEELFRLRARPTKHQPGNAIVFLRPKGKTNFKGAAKKYDELNGALKAKYETDTKSFAKHIKELFKNNAQIDYVPQETFEAYMIFLFEIARRLVTTEDPSEKKEELDVLPIGSAIASFVKLLELGEEKTCLFEDVFLPGEKFHCFTGKPEDRRKAIDNINKAKHQRFKCPQLTKEHHLKELQKLFCSEKRLLEAEKLLAKKFEGLKVKTSDSQSDSDSSWASSEYTTAFDYCE